MKTVRPGAKLPSSLVKTFRRAHRFERGIVAVYDVVLQRASLMKSEKQALVRCQQDHLTRVAWLDRQLSRAGVVTRQAPPPRCWITKLALWWDRAAAFWVLDELECRGRRGYESLQRKLPEQEATIVERSLLRRQRYTEAGCWHATHAGGDVPAVVRSVAPIRGHH